MSLRPAVLDSVGNPAQDRCVDVFVREDGTFGFEEYRRDPEDLTGWFPVGQHARLVFPTRAEAWVAARAAVAWLAEDPR